MGIPRRGQAQSGRDPARSAGGCTTGGLTFRFAIRFWITGKLGLAETYNTAIVSGVYNETR
jgi:hypothetical protein